MRPSGAAPSCCAASRLLGWTKTYGRTWARPCVWLEWTPWSWRGAIAQSKRSHPPCSSSRMRPRRSLQHVLHNAQRQGLRAQRPCWSPTPALPSLCTVEHMCWGRPTFPTQSQALAQVGMLLRLLHDMHANAVHLHHTRQHHEQPAVCAPPSACAMHAMLTPLAATPPRRSQWHVPDRLQRAQCQQLPPARDVACQRGGHSAAAVACIRPWQGHGTCVRPRDPDPNWK